MKSGAAELRMHGSDMWPALRTNRGHRDEPHAAPELDEFGRRHLALGVGHRIGHRGCRGFGAAIEQRLQLGEFIVSYGPARPILAPISVRFSRYSPIHP